MSQHWGLPLPIKCIPHETRACPTCMNTNNRRQEIQQMRRDVDVLALKAEPAESHTYAVRLSAMDPAMKLRMRPLQLSEKRRKGDLWLDSQNRLVPLALPWYRFYGVMTDRHVPHFRILP